MNQRPDLQALLAYWQKALRLLDWRIETAYAPDLQLNGAPCYGVCSPFVDDKAALIQIRDPETPIDPARNPAEMVERAVVHELLHLWWAPAGFRRPVEIAHEENAVWAITDALIAQKGTGQELRLARAMMGALGPNVSASGGRKSQREQHVDLTTLLAALEAAAESGDMKQVEALIAKIKAATGGGGEAPPPEERPQAEPPGKDKPTGDEPRGQRSPTPRLQTSTGAHVDLPQEIRTQLAGLDTFKRDFLLENKGHLLPETQRRWAATQPYDVVKGLLDATPEHPAERRSARPATPTRGSAAGAAAGGSSSSGEYIDNIVDRRMGVAREETPAVMVDPNTNKLFITATRPVTVGVFK